MAVKIAVPRENRPNERRVALVPTVAAKLKKLGAELSLEAGAGDAPTSS
jgi:H+-translocating NAD(P) transhydrogenase subunit alpha